MNTEIKKGETLMSKVILYSVLIGVILLCYVAYLMTSNAVSGFWERQMLREGPWGGASVWISEEGDLYMVAEESGEEGAACPVTVYLRVEDGWQQASVRLSRADQILVFDADGTELFRCTAEISNGTLVLSEFSDTAATFLGGVRERVTLVRCDPAEMLGEGPLAEGDGK